METSTAEVNSTLRRMDDVLLPDSQISSQKSTTSSDLRKSYLPPCRICGDKASGFHFGVFVCEACKVFFRRFQTRKKMPYCRRSQNCNIGPEQRNACSFCRYRKCLAVGMSKSATKTGRYSYDKRTKITLQVKETTQRETPHNKVVVEPTPLPSEPRKSSLDFDEMIKTIVEAHNTSHLVYTISSDEIEEKRRQYLEIYNLKLDIFGRLPKIPREQYEEIYQTTGLDVDNRKQTMRMFVGKTEEWIRRFINFVKGIPTFSELSAHDQINLVRASHFETRFLGTFQGYRDGSKVFVSPMGDCVHRDQMELFDEEIICRYFSFWPALQKLGLVPEEIAILKSICVFSSDRCQLQQPERVEQMQWKLVQCLLYLLDKNHKDDPGLFARIIDRLTDMRELTELNRKAISSGQFWETVQESELLIDILRM